MRLSQIRPPNPHTLGAGCSVSGGARDFGPATPYCGKKARMPRGSFRAPPNVCFQSGFRTGFAVAKRQARAQPGQAQAQAPAAAPAPAPAPASRGIPIRLEPEFPKKGRNVPGPHATDVTTLRTIVQKLYTEHKRDDPKPSARFGSTARMTKGTIRNVIEAYGVPAGYYLDSRQAGGGIVDTVKDFLKKTKIISRTAETVLPLLSSHVKEKFPTARGEASAGYMGRTAVQALKNMGYGYSGAGVPGRGSDFNTFDVQNPATSLSGQIPFVAPNQTFSGAGASSIPLGSNMRGFPSRKVEPVIFSTTWAPDQPAMNGVALRYYVGWNDKNPVV